MEEIQESTRFKPNRRSTDSATATATATASPEFDFWRLQTNTNKHNPSCPQLDLVSADDLFVDGVLVPKNNYTSQQPDPEETTTSSSAQSTDPEAQMSAPAPLHVSTKRWRNMFKKTEKKKSGGPTTISTGAASSAELNINLWPFSRSRSAGNACTRPKPSFGAPITRKVNSAPCSRSNSTGESKSTRKWPASPGRPGVHLGRSSPVWQARRPVSSGLAKTTDALQLRNAEKGANKKDAPSRAKTTTTPGGGGGGRGGSGGGAKARVLNLNVPTCIGYRSHLSCRCDVMHSAVGMSGSNNNRGGSAAGSHDGDGTDGSSNGGGVAGGNLFNLRSLFSKKVC